MDNLFDVTQTENKTFEKTRFLTLEFGQHIVRLLGAPRKVNTHFLRNSGATVECLGDECPICENNKKLVAEVPEAWKTSSYISKSERHYINVLDRTNVKVCPKCQSENKQDPSGQYSAKCWNCDTFITDVRDAPSGKVKVLNLSKTNADTVNSFNRSVLNENKEPIGVLNMDLMIMVNKIGGKKVPIPVPMPNNVDKVEVPEDALYDLSTVVIKLSADEIVHLLKGVSLKDIFVARREVKPDTELEKLAQENSEAVADSIKDLFKS